MNGVVYSNINGEKQISPYVQFDQENITLETNTSSSAMQIAFVLTQSKSSESSILSLTLDFTFSGTNANSYKFDQDIVVSLVNTTTSSPIVQMDSVVSDTPGEQKFTAWCNQIGTIYYAVSQSKIEIQTITSYLKIKQKLENNMIKQTEIGDIYENQYRTIYGYVIAKTAEEKVEISIVEKMEASVDYFGKMMCVNQQGEQSTELDYTWTQISNNAKPLLLKLLFLSTETTLKLPVILSSAQRNELTCIISEFVYKSKEYVLNSEGAICELESNLEDENATNSSLRMLDEENSNITVDVTDYSSYYEYFLIQPDPFLKEDQAIQDAQAILKKEEFASDLLESLSSLFSSVIISESECSELDQYPNKPVVTSPAITPNESSLSLSFTMYNTNGFIFIGLVKVAELFQEPTIIQLKMNQGYNFSLHASQFLFKDANTTITLKPLQEFTDYMFFWVATNEFPLTSQYQTECPPVKENLLFLLLIGNITTTGEQVLDAYYVIYGLRLQDLQFIIACLLFFLTI